MTRAQALAHLGYPPEDPADPAAATTAELVEWAHRRPDYHAPVGEGDFEGAILAKQEADPSWWG